MHGPVCACVCAVYVCVDVYVCVCVVCVCAGILCVSNVCVIEPLAVTLRVTPTHLPLSHPFWEEGIGQLRGSQCQPLNYV